MHDLFRAEAIAHRERRLAGDVILAAPATGAMIGWILLGLVTLLAIIAMSASYAKRETVRGVVAPEGGLVRIVAPMDGYVRLVNAEEMETVASGETLAVVASGVHTGAGAAGEQMASLLVEEAGAAAAGGEAALSSLETDQQRHRGRRQALAREREETRRQIDLLGQRRRLAEVDLGRSEEIARRGFMSGRDLDGRRAALIEIDRESSQLRQASQAISRELADADAELAGLPARIEAARANARAAHAQVLQRQVVNDANRESSVVSPVAGAIVAVFVGQGQTVRAGEPIAAMVPGGSRLCVELFVPSRAAGFVRAGQRVRIRYDAFPFQRFGSGQGVIASVSRSVLLPNEAATRGVEVGEPVFRARVRLDAQSVAAYGERIPLQPGMALAADIVVDRRSLAQWLLDPIYAVAKR